MPRWPRSRERRDDVCHGPYHSIGGYGKNKAIFHGELDNIVPVYLSRDMYREIVRIGGKNVHYTEYHGVRHNSWENVAKEKTLEEWLFAQRKKPVVSRTH